MGDRNRTCLVLSPIPPAIPASGISGNVRLTSAERQYKHVLYKHTPFEENWRFLREDIRLPFYLPFLLRLDSHS